MIDGAAVTAIAIPVTTFNVIADITIVMAVKMAVMPPDINDYGIMIDGTIATDVVIVAIAVNIDVGFPFVAIAVPTIAAVILDLFGMPMAW